MISAVPQRFGAVPSVLDQDALADLDVTGWTTGTLCYVVDDDLYFALKTSDAALVPDEVVAVNGITGARWLVTGIST